VTHSHPFAEVRALQSEYEELNTRPWSELSVDQRRGLDYYLADVGGPAPNRTIAAWTQFVHRLDWFVQQEGRMPVPSSRSPRPRNMEQSLVDRLSYQRRTAVRATHCTYQTRRLEGVPGFVWRPQHDRWMEQFVAYQRFWEENGRPPQRRSIDRSEASLGRWAAEQRAAYRSGELRPYRERLLRGATVRIL
jgi:hypothetical protein